MLALSVPILYSLELTAVCTNHCPGCSNVFARDRDPLPASGWQQVLTSIALHAHLLKLTGGEPTLHPEFADIIRAVAETGISFTLFTNARWSNPQAVIDLLKAAPQCGGLLISLHGSNAATHEEFTCTPGSFEETCENTRCAASAGLRVHTSTVLTRHNYDCIQDIATLAQSLGAQRAVFNRYIGLPMPDLEPAEWQLEQAISDIEALRRSVVSGGRPAVKYGNCIPQCFAPSSSTGCWAGVAYCTIDPWGNLRPCNHSPTIAGNILEEPIEAIWHNKIMNRWRARLLEQCQDCSALETCHGGCRALAEIRGTDPLIRQPLQDPLKSPIELTLYEKSHPTLDCLVRQESFGYALIRGHSIVPVTLQAKPILDVLDGCMSLQQIQANFGQDALDFVGSLYHQGLITMQV